MKAQYLLLTPFIALTACTGDNADYDATGVFETTEVIVSARATGEILTLNVEEGQQVEPGAELGVIDTLQLSLRKRQLLSSRQANDSRHLDVSRQVAHIKQQIANQQAERKRYADLLAKGAATAKQVDDIDYQIGVLQRQLAATQEQIDSNNSSLTSEGESLTAQVDQLDDQMRNAVIESPIKGVVLTKYAEQGEYATPGRALFKVGDISELTLRAYVGAETMPLVEIGKKVKVLVDSKEHEGTVSWISDEAEFTPKTIQTPSERSNLVYAVKINVKNDGSIRRGMYGDVKF